MYVMFDLNFPGMKLVKSELRLHGVVENHSYIENPSRLEKRHTTYLQHPKLNILISSLVVGTVLL